MQRLSHGLIEEARKRWALDVSIILEVKLVRYSQENRLFASDAVFVKARLSEATVSGEE